MNLSLKNVWWVYLSLIALAITIVLLIILITFRGTFAQESELVLAVSAVSLIISLYAFIVSYKTYTSIDSVNAQSIMEGNLMENQHYCTNLYQLLGKYDQKDLQGVTNALFKGFDRFGRKSIKGAELADTIQSLIDVIYLFPAFFLRGKDAFDGRMDTLILNAQKDIEALDQMNSGSVRLLEETLALFSACYSVHQDYSVGAIAIRRSILDVCGTMFKNSASLTVYYFYYARAYLAAFLQKTAALISLQKGTPLFSHESIEAVRHLKIEKDTAEELVILLQSADSYFRKAEEVLESGPVWEDMICLNRAYVLAFMEILTGIRQEWKDEFDSAVSSRRLINQIIDSLAAESGEETNYLAGYFKQQLDFAKCQRELFCSAMGD